MEDALWKTFGAPGQAKGKEDDEGATSGAIGASSPTATSIARYWLLRDGRLS